MLIMHLDRRAHGCRARRGFALPSAIFLLVVLAALAAFMVSLSTTQNLTQAEDVQGVRAYWAARSAAEYALDKLLAPEDESGATSFKPCSDAAWPAALAGQLEGFTILLSCNRSPAAGNYTEGGLNIVVYSVVAVASAGAPGALGYIERKVSMSAAKCKNPDARLADGAADPRHRC